MSQATNRRGVELADERLPTRSRQPCLGSLDRVIFLVIAFIVVPLVELYVIIKVGGAIGIGPTIALLLIDSLLGAFLLRHQGRAAWVAFNRAMAESRLPAKEVLDGVLIIFGGALLLTPGFITDIVGLCLLIPPTRAIVRTFLKWLGISRLSWGPKAAVWGYGRMQKDRGRRGAPRPANGGPPPSEQPRARPATEDFGWQSGGPRPGDIDGTAHEVHDDEDALPPGETPPGQRPPFPG